MNFSVTIPTSLANFLDCLGPSGRHNLYSVAANALKILVQGHIRSEVPKRHKWAEKLDAKATMHLQKGAARISFSADANHGEVNIPIAGMGRALHDVVITPTNARALTIPDHKAAYGHRVAELQRMGWMVFHPKGKNVLMGYQKDMTLKKGQHEAVKLYTLARRAKQRQDRSLLPSDADINTTVSRAMIAEIMRVQRKAG